MCHTYKKSLLMCSSDLAASCSPSSSLTRSLCALALCLLGLEQRGLDKVLPGPSGLDESESVLPLLHLSPVLLPSPPYFSPSVLSFSSSLLLTWGKEEAPPPTTPCLLPATWAPYHPTCHALAAGADPTPPRVLPIRSETPCTLRGPESLSTADRALGRGKVFWATVMDSPLSTFHRELPSASGLQLGLAAQQGPWPSAPT